MNKQVSELIKKFVRNLLEPCHTSAYQTAKELDAILIKFLKTPTNSDYGHSRFIIDSILSAVKNVKWNGKTMNIANE